MESDDDGSLDGVDWKEEEVTEQDRLDAEEELPPELRYNGEGENNCSDKRVVDEIQEVIPALTRVDEMAVIPDLKQLVEEKAVIPDPTLRVYESLSVITSPSRTVNERMSVITSPSQKSHSAAQSTAPAKPTDSSRIAHPPGGLAYDEIRDRKVSFPLGSDCVHPLRIETMLMMRKRILFFVTHLGSKRGPLTRRRQPHQ